ncbi:LrgB family protein [Anaerosinus massiliensis]|uniref:LrgB family protein n=1 Tax=Massilibacillus massiliensis TaxID=1806837 RepID=UPI000AC67241|nr:LrgB family protein [Massilibacillus massiliensis]
MEQIIDSPMLPIAIVGICIFAYQIGIYIYQKTKLQLLNPLFIAIVFIVCGMQLFDISLDTFNKGGTILNVLLCPATIMFALPMYKQRKTIRRNIVPIFVGSAVGSITSMYSIYMLCSFMGVDQQVAVSMVPKTTTAAIAMDISSILGGIPALTVASVICTGILGTMLIPFALKFFRIQHSIAIGIAIGTSSHALGSAKAVEIGETEGALAGIAVVVTGLVSVVIALGISMFA